MKTILPLFFFLFSISILNAQNPEWIIYNSSNSGLPGIYVQAIATEGSGTKWIGILNDNRGLAKFDNTTWTVYNKSNSGLPDNNIYSLAIDNSGNKWIGTLVGLAKFDGTTWTVYNTSNSGLPNNEIRAIAIDEAGNKWIGTNFGGLAKFDGTNWTVYNTSNSGIPNNGVLSIAIDGSGNKWIGTGWGLAKFNGTTWTAYYKSNSGLPDNGILSIAVDGSGNKWIGTLGGLAKFDGTTWTAYTVSNSGLPDNRIQSIAIDNSEIKWIGTWGGFAKFDGTTWTAYPASVSGIPANKAITSIAIDVSGNKWIGAYSTGVGAFKEGGVVIPAAQAYNCEFDNNIQSWNLYNATGAAATMIIDNNSIISGSNSCAVTISQTTGTNWHIQLWQWLTVYNKHKYTITFKAKASANRSIVLALQKGISPYTTYLSKTHNLTTQVQTFTDEVTINETDLAAKLQFYLGASTTSVWIDAITIVDNDLTTGIEEPGAVDGNISVLQNYPNPFNTTTTIKYKVKEPGFVSLKVFNAMGTELATLVNEKKPIGEFTVELNAAGLSDGIYFCRLQEGIISETKKLVLQK